MLNRYSDIDLNGNFSSKFKTAHERFSVI